MILAGTLCLISVIVQCIVSEEHLKKMGFTMA
jgi:hypothetical protein